MATLDTFQYQQDWETRLATRLNKPQIWKDVCDVRYSNTQTLVLPYISTGGEPAVSTDNFTTAAHRSDNTKVIPMSTVTQSSETLQILKNDMSAVYIDFADEAQSNYASQMQLADLLSLKMTERMETLILANSAAWTDFGDTGSGVLGLASTAITVTSTNVDDIIRGIIEQIYTANGVSLYNERGGFVGWRPSDWTQVVTFMQANGFTFADEALRDGGKGRMGKESMGLHHYMTNSNATGHLMAGVRGIQVVGLLNRTYGKLFKIDHPASTAADGNMSGTGIYYRTDYGLIVQTNVKPVIFDVNVA